MLKGVLCRKEEYPVEYYILHIQYLKAKSEVDVMSLIFFNFTSRLKIHHRIVDLPNSIVESSEHYQFQSFPSFILSSVF